jgi:predicted nucleic acid-binding protein
MRVALDTNILACAEGVNGIGMKRTVLALLEELPQEGVLLPIQSLGELFNFLVRKARRLTRWFEAPSTCESSG